MKNYTFIAIIGLVMVAANTNAQLVVKNNSDEVIVTVTNNGEMGIGTENPTSKLDVNGNIKARALAGSNNALLGVDENGVLQRTNIDAQELVAFYPFVANVSRQTITRTDPLSGYWDWDNLAGMVPDGATHVFLSISFDTDKNPNSPDPKYIMRFGSDGTTYPVRGPYIDVGSHNTEEQAGFSGPVPMSSDHRVYWKLNLSGSWGDDCQVHIRTSILGYYIPLF